MEKKGPDSITLTYDFLKWAIPALKKFPRDQHRLRSDKSSPTTGMARPCPGGPSTTGASETNPPGNTYTTPWTVIGR